MPDLKYLIYCRVSPKGSQRRELETSTSMQEEFCRRWIAAHGGQVVHVLIDEQETGRSIDRPGMQRLLNELESGIAQWDAIVVYRLDRFIRSMPDGAPIFKLLDQHNKGFASVQESIDMASPFGRAMLWILLAFAELESNQTSQRTSNRMEQIAARGEWLGGAPYGYQRRAKGDNVLVPDPEKAPIVKACFTRYAAGDPPQDIYRDFGISKSYFWHIIHNAVYIGRLVWGNVDVMGKHEPIISQELWDQVQSMQPDPADNARHKPGAQRRIMLLSGLIWCGCGQSMAVSSGTSRSGQQYHYYQCRTKACSRKRVSASKLESGVIQTIQSAMRNLEICEHIAAEAAQQYSQVLADSEPQRRQLRKALQSTNDKIEKYQQLFLSGVVEPDNAALFNDQLRQLRNQQAVYQQQLGEIEQTSLQGLGVYASAEAVQAHLSDMASLIAETEANPQARRAVIRQLLHRVTIHTTNEIELTFIGSSNGTGWLPRQDLNEHWFALVLRGRLQVT